MKNTVMYACDIPKRLVFLSHTNHFSVVLALNEQTYKRSKSKVCLQQKDALNSRLICLHGKMNPILTVQE